MSTVLLSPIGARACCMALATTAVASVKEHPSVKDARAFFGAAVIAGVIMGTGYWAVGWLRWWLVWPGRRGFR